MKTLPRFSGREFTFIGGIVIFFSLMLFRLVDVQVVRGRQFAALAEANRLFLEPLPAERGVLLDRYTAPLSYNKKVYFLQESPEQLFSSQLRLSDEVALAALASNSASVSYELERTYPFGESLAHLTGYTGLVTAEDLQQNNRLNPRDRVGKLGLEKVFEQELQGTKGNAVYEVNAFGKRQRLISTEQGNPGQSVQTTIDPYISEIAYRLLAGKKGSVVVLDAKTSEVLSLVTSPSFAASDLSSSFADEEQEAARIARVRSYFSSPLQLFFNRSINGAYPPGSVFKLVTAAAGLEKGVLDREKTVLDEGVLKVGEFSYANWYYTQYGGVDGEISLIRALARSNDIYFYKAAEWIGPFDLAASARQFGFGARTGIELGPEAVGNVPDPDWKQRVIGDQWYLGNTYHFGIGQGDVLVTPLQGAQMTQAVANRGALCAPRVISHRAPPRRGAMNQDTACKEIGISEENVAIVLEGMLDACSSGGTAYPFFSLNETRRDTTLSTFAQLENGAIACKTGTAEFGGQDERGYRKTHGWYTMAFGVKSSDFSTRDAVGDTATASAILTGDTATLVTKEANDEDRRTLLDASATEAELHTAWLTALENTPLPEKLVVTVLVESDEVVPYREGSRDAAPIAEALVEWMYTGSTTGVIEEARATNYQGE